MELPIGIPVGKMDVMCNPEKTTGNYPLRKRPLANLDAVWTD